MEKQLLVTFVMVASSIPLIFKWVPPNRLYGFRTRKTLSKREIWYESNHIAGWDLLLAGLAVFALSSAFGFSAITVLVPSALAVGHSFWALRRL